MTPAITVVIPVYNCEKYVERAVRSVLNQPRADRAEVLVVDDGSKDRSGEICDRLAAEFSNVRVFHKENGGVSTARNLGIEQAAGEYIAFLDSDDWWEPGFLDETILPEFASGGGIDVYEFAYRKVNYYVNMERVYSLKEDTLIYEKPETGRFDWQHPCAYVYKSAFLKPLNVRYPVVKMHEDTAFVEMVLYMAKSHQRINRLIFSYWENSLSCMHTHSIESVLLLQKTANAFKKDFFDMYGEPYDEHREMALITAECLPRLCAELSCRRTLEFTDENCNSYLRTHPQEKLWPSLQRRIEAYNRHPALFWAKHRITTGIPLYIKRVFYRIPGLRIIANKINSKYIQKMTPI